MKKEIRRFIEIYSKTIDSKDPIYEFGAFQVDGQEDIANLRCFFPGKEYIGCDMRKGKGVDKIINLLNIDMEPQSVGTALCLETLEHVTNPQKAVSEIYRVLKPNGLAIISSQMSMSIHNYPQDYWRFTPEAFKLMMADFKHCDVYQQGKKTCPHTLVGIGFKGVLPENYEQLKNECEKWEKTERKNINRLFFRITSPFIVDVIEEIVVNLKGAKKHEV
jgi:SAM-dependent methyltransferase